MIENDEQWLRMMVNDPRWQLTTQGHPTQTCITYFSDSRKKSISDITRPTVSQKCDSKNLSALTSRRASDSGLKKITRSDFWGNHCFENAETGKICVVWEENLQILAWQELPEMTEKATKRPNMDRNGPKIYPDGDLSPNINLRRSKNTRIDQKISKPPWIQACCPYNPDLM